MPKRGRPSREQGRLVVQLLRDDRTNPDGWLPDERAAVTEFHLWAFGSPPKLGRRPVPSSAGHPDRENDDLAIRAGDRPTPLPSEVLESLDGGRGIAGWIITPADLDHLRTLSRDPGDGDGDRIDGEPIGEVEYPDGSRTEGVVLDMVARHGTRAALAETDERLVWLLGVAGDQWGPLGVALAAAAIADPTVVRDQLARVVGPPEPEDSLADRLREFVANLAAEDWSDRAGVIPWVLQRPERIASSIEELVLGERVDRRTSTAAEVTPDPTDEEVAEARDELGLDETSPHPIAEDPRRPHLDHYPEDALLLTYREVRRLIALHLDACSDSPLAGTALARAMRDGETPLRVAEVLDR